MDQKPDVRKERAAVVAKVMKERGVKLGEASKIVKAEGLYKAVERKVVERKTEV
jgi:hypothetical protein